MKSVQIFVSGAVQGVGFRFTTNILANKMQICGFVKNLDDGRVYIEATAHEEQLIDFVEKLKTNHSGFAKVAKIEVYEIEKIHTKSFNIIY